jgi:tRNA U34 5-carboxymethylaminomethyl modifying GTPase MnmE/TrmE
MAALEEELALQPRHATVRLVVDPHSGEVLDEGMALWFPAPRSFTGEDVLELHVHGSRAVCDAVHAALDAAGAELRKEGRGELRQAHAGEFSLRAFEHGKMDLTQAEGLSDLLAAETALQRQLAVAQVVGGRAAGEQEGGTLRALYDGWREQLARELARVEAAIDFVDEDIDAAEVLASSVPAVRALRRAVAEHARHGLRGERGRLGLRVVLAGPPNAGKSALLNALARRPAAIVDGAAGTTRDVVEVSVALGDPASGEGGALPVLLSDTAGLRVAAEAVEVEGVRRARQVCAVFDWVTMPRKLRALRLNADLACLRVRSDGPARTSGCWCWIYTRWRRRCGPVQVSKGRAPCSLLWTRRARTCDRCWRTCWRMMRAELSRLVVPMAAREAAGRLGWCSTSAICWSGRAVVVVAARRARGSLRWSRQLCRRRCGGRCRHWRRRCPPAGRCG